MRKTTRVISISVLAQAVLLAGCSLTDPVRVEQDFGNSVRHMVEAQTYNPEAARQPASEPPTELDGPKAGEVLDTYRTAVGKPADVEKPIVINVGR
jgi:type IV pilus biogenesis protein CpaD/CtpE